MICFKDKTFCTFYKRCKYRDECHRAFTPEREQAAIDWWGDSEGGPPVCLYCEKPGCFKEAVCFDEDKDEIQF